MGLFDALRSPPRQPSVEEESPRGIELGEDLSNSSSSSELLSNHEVSDVHVAPTWLIWVLGLLGNNCTSAYAAGDVALHRVCGCT